MKNNALRRFLLPIIGIGGVGYALIFALTSSHPEKSPEKQIALPPSSSFSSSISGLGLIEANTRNIEVGSHLSGIVSQMLVSEGDWVEAGAPLFRLDDRTANAAIANAESNLTVAQAQVAEAEVSLADQRDQLARVQGLKAGFAVTVDRVSRLRFALRAAERRLSVAKASVESAEAQVKAANVTLQELTVNAPISGRILKLNTHLGEFVQAGTTGTAPLIMGNDTPLHVRVSLDENDLWRFRKEAKATGALRSNRDVTFPLTFVRIDPYVGPKTSLTGATSERVDTRVLEVVYRIEATDTPVYIGQQVDVFIEASPANAPAAPHAESAPVSAPVVEPVAEPAMPPASEALPPTEK